MIKIKEFANLCQCSTQTLRYYDQVKLLSPTYIDRENGYRYYEKSQLFDYIKIKNLQLADFSIAEIKSLLQSPNNEITIAFNKKIADLKDRLDKTLKIKETYHIESNMTKKLLELIKNNFQKKFQPDLVKQEFNLSEAELSAYAEEWEDLFTNALLSDNNFMGFADSGLMEEQIIEAMNKLETSSFKAENNLTLADLPVLQEFHAWNYLYEIMDDLCKVPDSANLIYYLEVSQAKLDLSFALPTILLQTVIKQNPKKSLQLKCYIQTSSDNLNHVYVLESPE